ncbi:MAG: helix-turn-helix transcriptional regulator [Clostridium sp.]|nr:helix-turn-helix transcriptional regulator [Clostridium sp.]
MTKKYDSSIGMRIREKREMLGYSREYVAEQAEMSPSFLSDVELGTKGFSASTLMKLCKVLGLSADYILFGTADTFDYMRASELLSGLAPKYLPHVEELLAAYMKSIHLSEN